MKIVITAQYGGSDAQDALQQLVISIRKKIKELSEKNYSDSIDSIKFSLGVSGEISQFKEANGCSNYKIMKKKRYASVMMTLHNDIWSQGDVMIKKNFYAYLLEAIHEIARRMRKNGLNFDADSLAEDLRNLFEEP